MKAESDNSLSSLHTFEIQSPDLNHWLEDSVTTTLPVTASHQVYLEFFFSGKEFWLDDVSLKEIE